MFKKIDIISNGYVNIRTESGRKTRSKVVYELAHWFIDKYLKPIEDKVKVWTHGKPYTGEIGGADFLMDKIELNWNQVQMCGGIDGLIARSRRDGAMRLIKFLREHPDYVQYLEIKENKNA